MDKLEILISSKLDTSGIISDLEKLKLKPLKVDIAIDKNALNDSVSKMSSNISNATKGIKTPQLQVFNVNDLEEQGRRYFSSAVNIVQQAKNRFKSMGDVDVNVFKDAEGVINRFGVSVKTATGIVEKFNFVKAQLESDGWQGDMLGFVQESGAALDKLVGSDLQKKLNNLTTLGNRLENLKQKAYELNKPITQQDHIDALNSKYIAIQEAIDKAKHSNSAFSDSQKREISIMIAEAERLRKAYQSVEYAPTKLEAKSIDFSVQEATAKLSVLENRWRNQGVLVGDFKTEVDGLKTKLSQVFDDKGLKNYNHELTLTVNKAKQLKDNITLENLSTNKKTLLNQIDGFFNTNTIAAKKYTEQISDVKTAILQSHDPTAFRQANLQWRNLQSEIRKAGDLGAGLFGTLQKDAKKFLGWLIASGGIMFIIQQFKQMYNNIKDIDTAMTELKKVTDETRVVYDDFLERSAENAAKLGTSISDLVQATAVFARLGYSLSDASGLGQIATIYKNVADGISNIDDASSILVSTLKAFNLEAKDAMYVADQLNEVGNRYAIGSRSLGESMKRSSASLSAAGNTIQQAIGLTTAAYEIIQDESIVGTALKTISMRLRNTAGALSEMGEDADGAAESVTKLQEQIKDLSGVDIMKDANTFKSTFQILSELSSVWGELDDKRRADITRLVSGVRQGQVFSALMGNFESATNSANTALESQGSALRENQVFLDSINGRISILQANFQKLSTNLIDDDAVKDAITLVSDLLNGINSIADTFGSFPTLITAVTAAFTLMGKNAGKTKVNMPAYTLITKKMCA